MKKLINIVINILFYSCMLFLLWGAIELFCYTSFSIPSDSMEPELIPGDKILVNKLTGGARLFDVFSALEKKDITIYRTPAIGSFKRNDVLVFNFPYPAAWDSIGFDVMRYYVKRCIGLPGDTLEISNGYFHIKGIHTTPGRIESQRLISSLPDDESESGVVMKTFPHDADKNWTIKTMGPLYIPAKGHEIQIDKEVWLLYHQLIFWEQKQRLRLDNGAVYLGDSVINRYRFEENYYFMAGDKLINSQDSRYWGFLPESFIVGRADYVIHSKNKNTGKVRWQRVMKKIQ